MASDTPEFQNEPDRAPQFTDEAQAQKYSSNRTDSAADSEQQKPSRLETGPPAELATTETLVENKAAPPDETKQRSFTSYRARKMTGYKAPESLEDANEQTVGEDTADPGPNLVTDEAPTPSIGSPQLSFNTE